MVILIEDAKILFFFFSLSVGVLYLFYFHFKVLGKFQADIWIMDDGYHPNFSPPTEIGEKWKKGGGGENGDD